MILNKNSEILCCQSNAIQRATDNLKRDMNRKFTESNQKGASIILWNL